MKGWYIREMCLKTLLMVALGLEVGDKKSSELPPHFYTKSV